MPHPHLIRLLVPDTPPHKRTERDVYPTPTIERRVRSAAILARKAVVPGLNSPSLISSHAGTIETILLALPSYAVADTALSAGYRSLIAALRPGTSFVVIHSTSARASVEPWFAAAGHDPAKVTWAPLPDYVSFTDWAEDGYVALMDATDFTSYLMEPWEFPRAGDALIAEAVQEYTETRAAQAPLIFQGGNCLVGDEFWLLGKDYFADSLQLLEDPRPPVVAPRGTSSEAFVRQLFTDYVDRKRNLIVLGTTKPIPLRSFYGTRSDGAYFLDLASDGAGTFQPIFHIDMFLTLVGRAADGIFEALVGSPALGDTLLGRASPYSLNDVYDTLAESLEAAGFRVHRNPLVHRPKLGRQITLAELRDLAATPEYADLGPAVDDLVAAGATDDTRVRVRTWHHVTWNNCLVENSTEVGKNVYLPTFGHGANADLAPVDDEMARLWQTLGFAVHRLADFNRFAERQGVVHCVKKYLRRGR